MLENFDTYYWNTRYKEGRTGWDLKAISPPLKLYIDQLENKEIHILIPGGGYNYEAQYLWEEGFKNITIIDLSEIALTTFEERVPAFAKENLIHANFFELEGQFDLILEQTFFCALDPSLRSQYVDKMKQLLKAKGKLVGLMFDFPLTEKGSPFGGDEKEYRTLFTPYFSIDILEKSYNSEVSRQGKELFFKLTKN